MTFGFVHIGQEAQIKVDTFNFTRYGLLRGKVLSVSQDAIVHDLSAVKKADNRESADIEAQAQKLSYAARVSLDRTQIRVDDTLANLSPGMAVTVEINTGSRSILSYLLSPLVKYGHDALRER